MACRINQKYVLSEKQDLNVHKTRLHLNNVLANWVARFKAETCNVGLGVVSGQSGQIDVSHSSTENEEVLSICIRQPVETYVRFTFYLQSQAACHCFLTVLLVPRVAALLLIAGRLQVTPPIHSRSSSIPGLLTPFTILFSMGGGLKNIECQSRKSLLEVEQ